MKLTNVVKDSKLPLKENKLIKPRELLSVGLYGPWKIKCKFEEREVIKTVRIWALTMIYEGLGWPDIAPIKNKYAEEIAKLVDNHWFNRYLRPLYCLCDTG